MAIQIVQASVNKQVSGSDTTLTLTNVTPGNLLIAFSAGGVGRYPGWTRFNSVYVYKVAQSTTESQLFPDLKDTFYWPIYLIEVSGVDRNKPIAANPFNYANTPTSTIANVATIETPAGAIAYEIAFNDTTATIPSVGSLSPTMTKKTDYTFAYPANAVRYELFSTDFNPGTRDVTYVGGANAARSWSELLVLNPETTPRVIQGNMNIVRTAIPSTAPSQGIMGGWGAFAFGTVYGGQVATSGLTTADRDQIGNSRIQRTIDFTIPGNMRVTEQPLRTQTGDVRIARSEDRLQTGNARVQATSDRTQPAISRVARDEDKTQQGSVFLESAIIATIQNQPSNSRILAIPERTQVGNTRIQLVDDNPQSGNTRITNIGPTRRNLMTNPRLTGTGATFTGGATYSSGTGQVGTRSLAAGKQTMEVTALGTGNKRFGMYIAGLTQTANAGESYTFSVDIESLNLPTGVRAILYIEGSLSGTAFTGANMPFTSNGRVYLKYTANATKNSVAFYIWFDTAIDNWTGSASLTFKEVLIEKTDLSLPYFDGSSVDASWLGAVDNSISSLFLGNQAGNARIEKNVDVAQAGNLAVFKLADQTIPGNSRVQLVTERTLQGDARISRENLQTINANMRIHAEALRTQTARASIRRENTETLIGHALVAKEVLQVISGGMRIIRMSDFETKPHVGIVDNTPTIGGFSERPRVGMAPRRPGSVLVTERPRVGISRNRP